MADANSARMAEIDTKTKPPPLLCLGAARTGTKSLSEALKILGYDRIHHGTNMPAESNEWKIFDRAADSTFETLPTYTGKPFTRADWDELTKDYDVTTELFAYFAKSLLPAYPEARVILVERDYDSWVKSWIDQKSTWYTFFPQLFLNIMGPLSGTYAVQASWKTITGWIGSNRRQDIFDKAGEAYVRHNKLVRDSVPAEQLLDYRLKDGWEPLCAFLGKDVPDVPFPHLNDLATYRAKASEDWRAAIAITVKNVLGLSSRDNTS